MSGASSKTDEQVWDERVPLENSCVNLEIYSFPSGVSSTAEVFAHICIVNLFLIYQ